MILESESLTDFLNRAYVINRLQSADNDNLEEAKKDQEELTNLEAKLREDAATLAEQKEQVNKDTTELNTKMASLQKTMDENKDALNALDEQKRTEQARIDDEATKKKKLKS